MVHRRMLKIMLKITPGGPAKWILSGQLSGPWVEELRAAWECRSCVGPCVVDLSDVTSIDERGEKLLRAMKADGTRFVARGVAMRHILCHLQSKAKPSLRRSLAHLERDCDCS